MHCFYLQPHNARGEGGHYPSFNTDSKFTRWWWGHAKKDPSRYWYVSSPDLKKKNCCFFLVVTLIIFCSSCSKPFDALIKGGLLRPFKDIEGQGTAAQQGLTNAGNCRVMPKDYNGTVDDFYRAQCQAAQTKNKSRFGKKIWFGYFWDNHEAYAKARDEYNE